MSDYRVTKHPVLKVEERKTIHFFWEGKEYTAEEGEVIAAALFAHGIRTFSFHHKDDSPRGIFCANGQCGQCTVVANGRPVKACMIKVRDGMRIEPLRGLPVLPEVEELEGEIQEIEEMTAEVLIIGGGPAGLSAAIELGKLGIETLLIDDKHKLGGKLVLQTHKFFGSVEDSYAGTRGFEIGDLLEKEVAKYPSVKVWLNSAVISVYSDKKVGVLKDNARYVLVSPKVMLSATGAREKSLPFPGNSLPGAYGAGAFQTLVNRDLIRASDRLFVVGGGNVGLIGAYHALQAGTKVVGIIEAMKEVGGYKVHKDKIIRMGVPVYTRHTIVSANGKDKVESVTIAQIDENFKVIDGTEKTFACDTILIAVGLDPIDEFHKQAIVYGMDSFVAGDAEEIAEASAAMFSGKISGIEIARHLGKVTTEIPAEWHEKMRILKSKPGKVEIKKKPGLRKGVYPIFHCVQEIPCNPCTSVCPQHAIHISKDNMMELPVYEDEKQCIGCLQCVAICPGLSCTLVDYRKDAEKPIVTIPYEFGREALKEHDVVQIVDRDGEKIGDYMVTAVRKAAKVSETYMVQVQMPADKAEEAAGIVVQDPNETKALNDYTREIRDDSIVCRCERVTAAEIRKWIRLGVRDLNQLKEITRAGMGDCGGKTCQTIILRLMREEGVPLSEITPNTLRPMFFDTPFKTFAGIESGDEQ